MPRAIKLADDFEAYTRHLFVWVRRLGNDRDLYRKTLANNELYCVEMAAERDNLRQALWDVLNCPECGGKGVTYQAIDLEDVEPVGCDCRDRAEEVLAGWQPPQPT